MHRLTSVAYLGSGGAYAPPEKGKVSRKVAHYSFQSILSQQWRSQGSGGGVLSREEGKFRALSAGHGRVGRLAAAYCLAFYNLPFDLLVSINSDFHFLIETQFSLLLILHPE